MTNRVSRGLRVPSLVPLALVVGCAAGAAEAPAERFIREADDVQFVLPPSTLAEPGAEPLAVLTKGQRVTADGTILVPFIGAVPVLGLTERELSSLVTDQVQAVYGKPIQVQARVVSR